MYFLWFYTVDLDLTIILSNWRFEKIKYNYDNEIRCVKYELTSLVTKPHQSQIYKYHNHKSCLGDVYLLTFV